MAPTRRSREPLNSRFPVIRKLLPAADVGDAAALGFLGNGTMTTADGRMVLSHNPDLLQRISADTGWRPRAPLRDGLARTVRWWRERLATGKVRRDGAFMT